jgi:4-aminobutyrate aminotransferase/(S)-3-amino-2-methylpropionate transaminase
MKSVINIKTPIPGPRSQALLPRRAAAMPQGPFHIAPIFVKRGGGATVTDGDGNVFLDFSGGLGSLNAGHANPKWKDLSMGWLRERDTSLRSA